MSMPQTSPGTAPETPVEELMIAAAGASQLRIAGLDEHLAPFGEALALSLAEYLRAEVAFTGMTVDYLAGPAAMDGIGDSAVALTAEFAPWPGRAALWLEPALLMAMLGAMLGDGPSGETRPLSGIERRIARHIGGEILKQFAASLAPVRALGVAHVLPAAAADDPAMADFAGANIRLRLGLLVGETEGFALLVLPEAMLRADAEAFARHEVAAQPGGQWQDEITQLISGAGVSVAAMLGEGPVSLGDLLDWRVGTVLDLGLDPDAPLKVHCGSTEMFRGVAGQRRNGRMALRITELSNVERLVSNGQPS